MGKPIDLVGKRFGRLLVVSRADCRAGSTHRRWNCVCDCGNACIKVGYYMVHGDTVSCGCFLREMVSKRSKTHGRSKSPEYVNWAMMMQRCRPESKDAHIYHDRGIGVCDRWKSFENFYADMGLRPSKNSSIDRVDNAKGYEPGNCRWASPKQQCRNNRRNRLVEVDGGSMTLTEACERTGIKYHTAMARVSRGWSYQDAGTLPLHTTPN